jgi:hypothetical protein
MAERDRPTDNRPANAPGPRPKLKPALAVVGVFILIVLVFAVINWLRYNT